MEKQTKNMLIACGILLVIACVLILLGVMAVYLISRPAIGV